MRGRTLLLALLLALSPALANAGQGVRSALSTLSLVLPEVRWDGVPLHEAVDQLRDISGGNFHVNWKALESVNITRDTPITMRVRSVTVRKTLGLMLSQLTGGDQVSFYNEEGVIEITTKQLADEKLVTRVYNIDDLLIIIPTIQPVTGSSNAGVSGNSSQTSNTSTGRSSGSSYSNTSRNTNNASGSTTGDSAATRQQMTDDLTQLIRDVVKPDLWKENGGPASIRAFRGNLIITAPRSVHELIGGPIE